MTESTNMFSKSSLKCLMTLWSWENLSEEPNMNSERSFKFLSSIEIASTPCQIFLTFLKSMLSSLDKQLPTKWRSSGFNRSLLLTETCLSSTRSSWIEWWKEDNWRELELESISIHQRASHSNNVNAGQDMQLPSQHLNPESSSTWIQQTNSSWSKLL